MHTCLNCGEFVSTDFVRVFGTNDREVYACTACAHMSEILDGRSSQVPAV